MSMRLAVLGGTFSPPTLAHLDLMRTAIRFSKAAKGIFVPASMSYIQSWRADRLPDPLFTDPATRESLLRAMIDGEENMDLCTRELTMQADAYTYDTLVFLSQEYHTRDILFVTGSDNLQKLSRWHRAEDLLSEFRLLAAPRFGDDIQALLSTDPFLARHQKHISSLPFDPAYQTESAETVRELIRTGNFVQASKHVHPAVLQYLRIIMERKSEK